jgi:hypothetical protein
MIGLYLVIKDKPLENDMIYDKYISGNLFCLLECIGGF